MGKWRGNKVEIFSKKVNAHDQTVQREEHRGLGGAK